MLGYQSLVSLATLLLQLRQTLAAEMTRINKGAKEVRVEATVERGRTGTFQSPGFPSCCERTTLAYYTLRYEGTRSIYGLSMLFDDLDLPPDSTIQINNLNNTVYATPLPRYTRHGWTRPYVILPGTDLLMIVKFGLPGHNKYVGFKSRYWPESKKPVDDVPYTECPPVRDAMDGGQVSLETTLLRWMERHYRYDCVWQLKPPPTDQGMVVYLRIESFDLSDGVATIRRDVSSDGPILKEYKYETFTADADDEENMFNSLSGFYIRVEKPHDSGHFRFSYGVYVDYGVSMDGNTECSYGLTDLQMEGYHCQHGSSWCIPLENRCDGRRNCPGGDDEEGCPEPTERSAQELQALVVVPCDKECSDGTCLYAWNKCPEEGGPCAPKQKQCDDNSCVMERETCVRCQKGQKRCIDGTCIAPSEECPGTCGTGEKKCMDGSCVPRKTEKCPEEAKCPGYKEYQCLSSRECYYAFDRCDGSNDCIDGSDEQNCQDECETQGKLACDNGNGCYFPGDRCDNHNECSDHSDEVNCGGFSWYELKQWAFVPVLPIIFASCVLYLMKKEQYTKEQAIKRQERELLLWGGSGGNLAWSLSPFVPMVIGIMIIYMAKSEHKEKQKKRARQRAQAAGGIDNQGSAPTPSPRPLAHTRSETAADRAAAAREHLAQTSAYHSIVARAASGSSSRPPSRSPRHSRSSSNRGHTSHLDAVAAETPRPVETPPPPYDDAVKIIVDAPPEEAPPSYSDVSRTTPLV